jgi:CheY-like chemotaxis protein
MLKMAKPYRFDRAVFLMRNGLMIKNRTPCEVGDTDAYNELQISRIARTRYGSSAALPLVAAKRRLRVLVVDDHRASADTLSMLVKAWGHDVRRNYEGAGGLALAADYLPDVLLLDIMMPKMSGSGLAMQIRRDARLQNCLLIAITGVTDERRRLHCLESGVDLFLIKPVIPSMMQPLLMAESKRLTYPRRVVRTAVVESRKNIWTDARLGSPAGSVRNTATIVVAN